MGDDLKVKAAAALRMAEVGARRSVVVADRYGRRAAQSAVVIGRRINEEYGPAVQGYGHRLTIKYGIDDKFALRPVDSNESFSEAMGPELEALRHQIQELPLCAAPPLLLVFLRALKGSNVIISEVIRQWLSSGTKFARLSLLATVVPGWAAFFLYRRALLESRPPPTLKKGLTQELEEGVAQEEPWAVQAARDARRLPGVFWFLTGISATVTLQVVQQISTATIRGAFQIRKRSLIFFAAVYYLAQHHGERATEILEGVRGRLSPETVESLENKWKLFHAVVSNAARRLVPAGPAKHGGGSRFASRGSVDQDTIDRLLAEGSASSSAAPAAPTAQADEERN